MKSVKSEIRKWSEVASECDRRLGIVCICGAMLASGSVVEPSRCANIVSVALTDRPDETPGPEDDDDTEDETLFLEDVTVLTGAGTQLRLPYLRVPWAHVAGYTLMRARPEFGRAASPPQSQPDVLLH